MRNKIWHPDPKVADMLWPLYEKKYPAYVASLYPFTDNEGNRIKNPNIKTCFKYWKFWKQQDAKVQLASMIHSMNKRREQLENFWLPKYDDLILVGYEIGKTIEDILFPNGIDFSNIMQDSIEIDIPLHKIFSKVTMLRTNILDAKFQAENNILLNNYRFNHWKNLRKITLKVHSMLLRVMKFFSKRNSKKLVLNCQHESKNTNNSPIIIKCGICATKVLQKIVLQNKIPK